MQILIIDDSPTTRGLLRRALELQCPNCLVREAQDGKSAVHVLGQAKVDLIITDLEMPGVDGHHFLGTLRQNPLLRRKKVLVFSSAITQDLIQSFADNPNVAFLSKPSSQEAICQAVQSLMNAATVAA